MTQPAQVQIDMGRVVQRATDAAGSVVGGLAAELGMAREVLDVQGAKLAEKEKELAERDAEIARLRQTNDLLQQRIQEIEADPTPTGEE